MQIFIDYLTSHLLGLFCLFLLLLGLLLQFYTEIMDALRLLLLKAIEMIDEGECGHITAEEFAIISDIIHAPTSVGREDAAKFLGVSLNEFHRLRDEGVILPARKRRGFKELEYFMVDLKKAKEKLSAKTHL